MDITCREYWTLMEQYTPHNAPESVCRAIRDHYRGCEHCREWYNFKWQAWQHMIHNLALVRAGGDPTKGMYN